MYDWAEFRILKWLMAVMEHKGFRAAAEHLNTAQPNLSARVKQFQEASGLHLYRITKGNRIRLTQTGVAFRPIVTGLFNAQVEAMDALLAIEHGNVRSLRLGCASSVDQAIFHTACALHREIIPACPIRAAHGDTVNLLEEIVAGDIDAALVTLPVNDARLRVEEIRRDRLVVCLRQDHPLAVNRALQPADLQGNLAVLYDPRRHPKAHERLLELFEEAGVRIEEYSRASHPSEMQELVKQGYGLGLIREGATLDSELTTRPIVGVDWTVDTAFVYGKRTHPKTIPVLVRHLKQKLNRLQAERKTQRPSIDTSKRPPQPEGHEPEQLWLLG
jgi:DNA-binding transcriptional LysR family regulator